MSVGFKKTLTESYSSFSRPIIKYKEQLSDTNPTGERKAPIMLISISIALAILANTNTGLPNKISYSVRRLMSYNKPSQLIINYGTLIGPIEAVEAVDCFKCSSRNGSNPACEDPFHNLNTTRITSPVSPDPPPSVIYHTPCYAGKKGRDGLFPASACIKLTGTFDTTGETLVVRHCALDSGTLTQDTELARMSHCGKFQFEGDLLKGCVLACPEDACNSAPSRSQLSLALMVLMVSTQILVCSLAGNILLKH